METVANTLVRPVNAVSRKLSLFFLFIIIYTNKLTLIASLTDNDCKGNGSNRRQNEDCSQTCKYIEVNCYEDCRDPDGGDNSISTCLGDCEVNMDDDTKKKIKDRTTRDMDCMDECEEKHGSSGAKYDKCVGKCDDEGILSFN